MRRFLAPLVFVVTLAPVFAAPEMKVEAGGVARVSGSTLRLASDLVSQVTDPIEFPGPSAPLTVAFPNVVPGDYFGQLSFDGDIFSAVTGLIVHPAAGTLTFTHDPGPVVKAFYRLQRVIDSCAEITIRNTGDTALTGLGASLTGADFTLDTSGLATSLAPAGTTTLTVCFTGTGAGARSGSLNLTSDTGSFTFVLVGDNAPGPIVVVPPVPVITVITNRTSFETAVGPGRITDDFSVAPPVLPVVTSHGGNVAGGKWNDIARTPEPSTVWTIPGGATAWGGIWDLTVSGTGGGITCELDFGGGTFIPVPGQLAGGSVADVFFGFTADQPFYAVRVRQFDSAGNTLQETHSFDDLTFQPVYSGEIAVHDGPSTASPQLIDGQVAPVDFAAPVRGVASTRTFTLTNTAAEPLRLFKITAGGFFQVSNSAFPAVIASGESLNFDVTFLSASGGLFEETIKVLTSDSDETTFEFPVRASIPLEVELQLTDTRNNLEITNGQATVVQTQPDGMGGGFSIPVLLFNAGLDPLNINAVSLPAGFSYRFSSGSDQAPRSLSQSQFTTLVITVTSPTAGIFEGNVVLTTNDPDDATFTFPIRGEAAPAPEIRIAGPVGEITNNQGGVFQFDSNAFGGGTAHSFKIHNDGSFEPLVLSSVSLPAGFSTSLTGLPRSIEPGQSLSLVISSIGPTQGVYEGNVVLVTNDSDEGVFTFPIRALFNMPEIVVGSGFFGSNPLTNGGTLDVGTSRLGATAGFSLRVQNLHAGPLTVSGITLPAGYQLAAPAPVFPFSLGRNQARDISISIITTTAGTFSGTLAIQNNDFDESPFNIELSGIVSPESILFLGFNTFINEGNSISAFASGSGPVTYAWDLDGDGEFDDALGSTIQLPDSDGPGTFPASVRMTDSLTSMIRTESIPIVNRTPLAQTSPPPQNIIAGTSLVLNVTANDAPVDRAAGMTWRIDWGGGNIETTPAGHPATTMFSRVLTQPGRADVGIQVTDKDGATGSSVVSVWVYGAVFGVFDGPNTGSPELRDGDSRLSFATLAGGLQDRPLTVLNRSASPATIGPVTLPAGFSLVAPPAFPAVIAPGATLALTLRFAPLLGGNYVGPMTMATSDPLMPSFDLDLRGSAAAPEIIVSHFSSEQFGFASGEQSFDVFPGTQPFTGLSINIESDNAEAPLIISAIELPPNFQLENPPAFPINFSSSSSRDIRIQCNGASPGFYKGWVTIHSNDPDDSPFRFFVWSNVGNVADLLVKSDGSDSFSATGIIFNGQSTPLALPLQLRLRNQGSGTLTVSAITLPAGFAFASPPALPLNLSGSSTLPQIVLTATAPGTYSGQVVITSTDPDENPFQFALSATVPGGEPQDPELTAFNLVPATAGSGVVFSGGISGPPNATVVVEGSRDLGKNDPWTEVTRVTLDGAGRGTIGPATAPDTLGVPRFFVRLKLLSP